MAFPRWQQQAAESALVQQAQDRLGNAVGQRDVATVRDMAQRLPHLLALPMDVAGDTVLHLAVRSNLVDMVSVLLQQGMGVNVSQDPGALAPI
jgi:hypothetical protein